jgi:hypothetical protein
MKTRNYYLGISILGLIAFLAYGCKTSTPGDAVRSAMEKEIIKDEAEAYIDEPNVPAVVVDEFIKDQSDTIERKWLVLEKEPQNEVKVVLPEVFIVAYKSNDQNMRDKYSKEGELIDRNHLVNLSVLPQQALDLIQKGEYKDWEVVGDVYETLDNITFEPIRYIVTLKKAEEKERLFFDFEGNILKIQQLTK